MNRLPNELLEQICVDLGKDDLLKTLQLFSRLRHVARPIFLMLFGISQSDIQTGNVSLHLSLLDPFVTILVVAHACPIQRLVCFEATDYNRFDGLDKLAYERLLNVLAATPKRIPHILIYNRLHSEFEAANKHTLVAELLARLPQTATDTLLLVDKGSSRLSCPRRNYGGVSGWFHRSLRSAMPDRARFAQDLPGLLFGDWLRIQSLPGKYMLVTLANQVDFVITPMPELPKAVYSSFISAFDLGPMLSRLTVQEGCNIQHEQLMELLYRHPRLHRLICEPGAIRPSSFVPGLNYTKSGIRELSAPITYIPYLLPGAPGVGEIYIPFPFPASKPGHAVHFDAAAYVYALDEIAALPYTSVTPSIHLILSFDVEARGLPWNARNDATAPERRLTRVTSLVLSCSSRLRYNQDTLRSLPRWIGLFPNLQRVSFAHNTVEDMPESERQELMEGIRTACRWLA